MKKSYRLRPLLDRYLSRMKGSPYRIDERIPASYLFRLLITRALMKLRGACSGLQCRSIPFIGRGATIKARAGFSAGRNLSIGTH